MDLYTVQQFILHNFGVRVSYACVSRHKDDLGLSIQLTHKRPIPVGVTKDEYVLGYFEFCKRLIDGGFFDFDRKKILCLDSVTNSLRSDRTKTMHLKGAAQKRLNQALPTYTNNYLVCVAMEEGIEFDVMMFTHDPAFDPQGKDWPKVVQWCRKLGLRTDRIFYTKSSKKYCAEQAAHISTFKSIYRQELADCRILHDGGSAYKLEGEYILEDGASELEILPSIQHGRLSPLDNKLNAVAKNLWKADRSNKDFVYDSLLLMKKLESVGQDDISKWWVENFMLDAPELTLNFVAKRLESIRGKEPIRQILADKYLAQYDKWSSENVEQAIRAPPKALECGLDGSYYRK